MTDFFKTDRLTVGYDGVPLIRDICLSLERGQILTLIGPNGSGKSTILKSLTRQLKSLGGTVSIDGRSIANMSSLDLARQVSVVWTDRLKPELMTCREVVATGRYPYTGRLGILSAADRAAVFGAMELVDALPLAERDFTRISDGQRQRILLARAICQEPRIIVLDEPTSFLDIRYKLELLGILRSLAKERGITVIMSLHELELAQKASDLVLCVKDGAIAHIGSPREVFGGDRIRELFGLTDGSYNPGFGSFELARPGGVPRVFVIAGGGTGIPQYRALQQRGIPFATGILHENDVDFSLARDLAGEVIAEQSFEPIRPALLRQAIDRLKQCGAVINCLNRYGELNLPNRELAEAARSLGLPVVSGADELPCQSDLIIRKWSDD